MTDAQLDLPAFLFDAYIIQGHLRSMKTDPAEINSSKCAREGVFNCLSSLSEV